ncbi:MAG: RHS repeat domain-containing protein [Bacteroidota bacterium]
MYTSIATHKPYFSSQKNKNVFLMKPILPTRQVKEYCLFGAPMGGSRSFQSSTGYRYGFNGQEKDDEIAGNGNINTAEFWQYDTRLGRRWNTDPIVKPWESPYATFANNPIWFSDVNGDDAMENGDKGKGKAPEVDNTSAKKMKEYVLNDVIVTPKSKNFLNKVGDIFQNIGNKVGNSVRNAAVKSEKFFNELTGNIIIWGTGTSSAIKESAKQILAAGMRILSVDAGAYIDFLNKYNTPNLGGEGGEGRKKGKETASEENVEGMPDAIDKLNETKEETILKKQDSDSIIITSVFHYKDGRTDTSYWKGKNEEEASNGGGRRSTKKEKEKQK